jgi:hypothetical protein
MRHLLGPSPAASVPQAWARLFGAQAPASPAAPAMATDAYTRMDPVGGAPAASADEFLAKARLFLGQRYLWGGGHVDRTFSRPGPVDCSGLVQQAARMAGFNLDGTAAMQQRRGTAVSLNNLQPGDLLFKGNPATHVGIYIGNGQFIHAPRTGDVVKIQSMSTYRWQSARRIFNVPGQPLQGAVPADAPSNGPNGLRRGSEGSHVRRLQQALTELGFNPGGVDGEFGPKTDAALRAFQRAAGIKADGEVGPTTWAAIARMKAQSPAPAQAPVPAAPAALPPAPAPVAALPVPAPVAPALPMPLPPAPMPVAALPLPQVAELALPSLPPAPPPAPPLAALPPVPALAPNMPPVPALPAAPALPPVPGGEAYASVASTGLSRWMTGAQGLVVAQASPVASGQELAAIAQAAAAAMGGA